MMKMMFVVRSDSFSFFLIRSQQSKAIVIHTPAAR